MSLITKETDAQFYQMIHELIDSQCETNRRSQQRDSFNSNQLIAPMRGEETPHPSDFFEVRCNDLTSRGFSFFIEDAPDFDKLAIVFESPDKTIYVQAEVRHHREVLLYPKSGRVESLDDCARCGEHFESQTSPQTHETGIPTMLVGCRFTGRLE